MSKKQSRKRDKYNFTLEGQRLFSFFSHRKTNGATLGFADPKIGDVHLTMAEKNGRVFWHITDGREVEKTKKYPFAGHLPKEEFEKRISNLTDKFIKKYHGNKYAWIMTDQLREKINNEYTKSGLNFSTIPLEIFNMGIICDFKNKDRWTSIRIKDMIPNKILTAYIIENSKLKMVYPKNSNEAIFVTKRQIINLFNELNKLLGVEEYLNYTIPEIEEPMKRKISEIRNKSASSPNLGKS